MNPGQIELIGLSAAVLTTGCWVPQIVRIAKTRDVSGISVTTYVALVLGTLLWSAYGMLTANLPTLVANVVSLSMAILILILRHRYAVA